MRTEAQRRADAAYKKKQREAGVYTSLTCCAKTEKALAFKAACAERSTTPNAVFNAAIDRFLKENAE